MLNCIHVHIIITKLNRGYRTTHTRQKHATKRARHECTLIAPQLRTDDMRGGVGDEARKARGGKVTRTTLRRSSRWRRRQSPFGVCTARRAGGVWSAVDDLDEVAAGPTAGSGGAAARSTQCCQYADVERPTETMTFRAKRVGRP